jgi:hypothetical protein
LTHLLELALPFLPAVVNPKFNMTLLWFRGVSGEQLATLKRQHPDRVTLVKVPMRSTVLCQECAL